MTYSKEAMDKALDLLNGPHALLWTEGEFVARVFATYIQQVSDALKRADEEMADEFLAPNHKGREALKPFILPDPVDPLLLEAREIVAKLNEDAVPAWTAWAKWVRGGDQDDHPEVQAALAALKSREAK